jgi:hypothetical protein
MPVKIGLQKHRVNGKSMGKVFSFFIKLYKAESNDGRTGQIAKT